MHHDAVLEVSGLTKVYQRNVALDNVSFTLAAGDAVAVIGPNGSGKTTLISIILGLVRQTAGAVSMFGRSALNRHVRRRIGCLVDEPAFYPHLTGTQNLQLFARLKECGVADLRRAIDIAGVADFAIKRVETYSLGMKQRLALAAALLSDPDLIILDEPTNGLDPIGIRDLREVIDSLKIRRKAVILCSHLLAEAERTCSHVLVLQNGTTKYFGLLQSTPDSGGTIEIGCFEIERAVTVLRRLGPESLVEVRGGRIITSVDSLRDASLLNAELVREGISVYHFAATSTLEELLFKHTAADEHPLS